MPKRMSYLNVGEEQFKVVDEDSKLAVDAEAASRRNGDAVLLSKINAQSSYNPPDFSERQLIKSLVSGQMSGTISTGGWYMIYASVGSSPTVDFVLSVGIYKTSSGQVIQELGMNTVANSNAQRLSTGWQYFAEGETFYANAVFPNTGHAEIYYCPPLNAADAPVVDQDQELLDIRVGYDATEYADAGTAVRSQISDLHADIADLADDIAHEFSDEGNYVIGDYVRYNGNLYKFTSDHAAGEWDSADVVQVTLMGQYTDMVDVVQDWLEDHPEATTTVQDGSITENKLSASVKANVNAVPVLSARIDNIASLDEGSTTGDAELMDIRVGADGTTYSSAGDAVRGQTGELKRQLNNAVDLTSHAWTLGSLSPGSGSETSSNTRIKSDYIFVTESTEINLTGNANCLIVYAFDENKGYLSDSNWTDGNNYIVGTGVSYVRILIRKDSSNTSISSNEISTQVERCSVNLVVPSDTYFLSANVANLEKQVGNSTYRQFDCPASSGQYWNINIDDYPIKSGSIVRFTLESYGGTQFNTVYFKGRKSDGSTITNVTLANTKTVGKELIVQTTEDYIGYQVQVYRNASEGVVVSASYRIINYIDDSITNYILQRTNDADGVVYDSEVQSSIEAVQTVLASSGVPMLTMAVFTDLHHDSKYQYDPTNDLMANINALNNRLHFDALMNLGDAIDGQYQTQYDAEGCIADVINSMYEITDRSYNLIGNHDDNVQSTWSNRGNQPASEQLTLLEINDALFKGSNKEVHNPNHITDYYVDFEAYGIRMICVGVDYTSYNANTQTWLANVALDTDKKVLVFSHCATKAEWGYMNDVANGSYIETPLNNFVSNGGTVVAFIHGHTHGDMIETDSSISFTEVAIGCAKFEKLSSGTTGMTYQDRNANDYTKILFDIVCVDQTNRQVHFIRCGAGTDRTVSY